MVDNILKLVAAAVVVALVTAAIMGIQYNNQKSWEQTQACNAKGGVMMTAPINGCVRITTISSGE